MPGSKTFTSHKGNELLKNELIETLHTINDDNARKIKHTVTWEMLKAVSSGIIVKVITDNWNYKIYN